MSPLMPVYRRSELVITRGEGCYLYDDSGRKYLDFAAGIAVNSLGHCHPHLVKAITEQAQTLWHCSNLYRIPEAERLAERLVKCSGFAESVFFCSSGTEAVEAAIKIARRYHWHQGTPRSGIITFEGGFHGRTYAGISAGGGARAKEGYAPVLPGFTAVAYNNIDAVRAAITPETGAVMIEVIQGEGGIREATPEFLQSLRSLCDERGLLLIADEVQCGMGRSGHLFAFDEANITPDLCTIAKGIGGGFPLAAVLATAKAASAMTPGSHGSTYGANPLAMRVGNAVLDVILEYGFLIQMNKTSFALVDRLKALVAQFPAALKSVRGRGFMLGLETMGDPYTLAAELRKNGLLTAPAAGDKVIRLLPPLIADRSHVEEAIEILTRTCQNMA